MRLAAIINMMNVMTYKCLILSNGYHHIGIIKIIKLTIELNSKNITSNAAKIAKMSMVARNMNYREVHSHVSYKNQ